MSKTNLWCNFPLKKQFKKSSWRNSFLNMDLRASERVRERESAAFTTSLLQKHRLLFIPGYSVRNTHTHSPARSISPDQPPTPIPNPPNPSTPWILQSTGWLGFYPTDRGRTRAALSSGTLRSSSYILVSLIRLLNWRANSRDRNISR